MRPSTLDCAECEARILDLLELDRAGDAQLRGEVRALLERCPDCRDRFRALQRTQREVAAALPVPEPPAHLDARILAAARARAAAVRGEATAGPESGGAAFWERIVAWVGQFAMRPQVTMATLTLVVIAIGIWYVRPDPAGEVPPAGEVVLAPDPLGEAAPSASPADPEPPPAPAPDAPEEKAAVADRRGGERRRTRRDEADAPSRRAAARASGGAEGTRDRLAEQADEAAAPTRGDALAGLGRGAPDEGAAARAPASSGAAPSGVAPADDALAANAARERAEAPAVDLEEAVPETPTLATQAHDEAREALRGGRTREAIARYEALLARYPSYLRRGQALLELSDAYRRAGRTADARRAAERARRYPGLEARARAAIDALSPSVADEAAAGAAAAPAEAAPAAEEPAADGD